PLARETAQARGREDLLRDERAQTRGDLRLMNGPFEHGLRPAFPERLAEHARRAQDGSLRRREYVETGLHHGEDGVRECFALAISCGPDHLFEVKGVPFGPRHDAGNERGVERGTEHPANEVLGRLWAEAAQRDLVHAAPRPQIGERVAYLG